MKNRLSLPRLAGLLLCLVLVIGLLPTALAAPVTANYDISVQAKDGLGLNLRSGPGTEYPAVRSSLIPMNTRLRISQTDTSSTGALWGYTTYDGTSGWVCLVETQVVTSSGSVTSANYSVYVNAKDGQGLNMRTQAGTEYPVLRSSLIPMYTRLYITKTTTSSTGALWGYTTYEGVSGWVCLVETTTYDPRPAQEPTASSPAAQPADEPAETAASQSQAEQAQSQQTPQTSSILIGVVIGLLVAILLVLLAVLLRKR